jgi:hypothetical protein
LFAIQPPHPALSPKLGERGRVRGVPFNLLHGHDENMIGLLQVGHLGKKRDKGIKRGTK